MGALLFKIAFLGAAAAIGAVTGWCIRGASPASSPEPESDTNADPTDVASEDVPTHDSDQQADFDSVEVMMAQLQQMTSTVAADVGEHSSKVREINDELTAATASGTNVLAVVEKLMKANEEMQTQLEEAESQLNEQAEEIETHVKEARTDALTKLWNRRYFDDEMKKCSEALTAEGKPSSIMMLDVDHFKKFNDTYGHQAGDEVLRGVARTLKKAAGKDIVCRYGGEEFAIILPGSDINTAIPIAEKARAAIAEQVFEFEGLDLKVSASGGLAQIKAGESVDSVVKRADDALYVCKENGRNCGYWHDGAESHPMVGHEPETEEPFEFSDGEVADDNLSDLSDEATFQSDIDRRIAEWKRGGATLSVLVVEIDKYDSILKTYGDNARDVVRRAAAQFLKAAMREMDHIARFDDDHFGLLLPGAEVTETSAVAERLRTAIARCSLPLGDEKITFTVSIGAAEVAETDNDESLIKRAESSLAAARKTGGNCSFAATTDGEVRSMALSS